MSLSSSSTDATKKPEKRHLSSLIYLIYCKNVSIENISPTVTVTATNLDHVRRLVSMARQKTSQMSSFFLLHEHQQHFSRHSEKEKVTDQTKDDHRIQFSLLR